LMGGQIQAAGTGLGGLTGLAGIAELSDAAPMSGYAALARILGGPTTLTDQVSFGQSTGTATSKSKSGGFSLSFGGG